MSKHYDEDSIVGEFSKCLEAGVCKEYAVLVAYTELRGYILKVVSSYLVAAVLLLASIATIALAYAIPLIFPGSTMLVVFTTIIAFSIAVTLVASAYEEVKKAGKLRKDAEERYNECRKALVSLMKKLLEDSGWTSHREESS